MSEAIHEAPLPEWKDYDTQCARCGSSTVWEDCCNCGGEGYIEDDDWQCPETRPCDWCKTTGGFPLCCSGEEWCTANPIPGREAITHGAIEYFEIVRSTPPSEQTT